MQDILDKARLIKLVIFDVDGVLTDGSLFLGDDGQEYKAFNSKDGLGMKLLQASGVEVIHLGHNRSVLEIVDAAIQEDAQGIAVSSAAAFATPLGR